VCCMLVYFSLICAHFFHFVNILILNFTRLVLSHFLFSTYLDTRGEGEHVIIRFGQGSGKFGDVGVK